MAELDRQLNGRPRILVVGAGIAGLAAAVALKQRGFAVEVYEQGAELRELGAGLQIAPNAAKVLAALGLEAKLRRFACEPKRQITRNWKDGAPLECEEMRETAVRKFGAPYLTVHRADLHRMLMGELPAAALHLGVRCLGVTPTASGGVVELSNGEEVEAQVIIGADGIRSSVRESLFGSSDPKFTAQTCWRGMLPMACLAGSALDPEEYVSWLGPTGRVLCYPVAAGRLLNIFAGYVGDRWTDESWSIPATSAEVLEAYEGWDEALLEILSSVEVWFKWGIFDRDPLERWTRGGVTLLGDAAHPMTPTLAQGAAMAIEDAYVLAKQLSQHRGDPGLALRAYEEERVPRTTRIHGQARAQARANLSVPPIPRIPRDWIYAYDATAG